MNKILDQLKFNNDGLIPVIIQDHETHEVLMLAYMNREAVERSLAGPYVTFWSRSRKKFWVKGEDSGHTQEVKKIFLDCDEDALLIQVDQKVAACHEGFRSCFFREIEKDRLQVVGKRLFDPKEVYKK